MMLTIVVLCIVGQAISAPFGNRRLIIDEEEVAGRFSEMIMKPCDSSPCFNGGTCENLNDGSNFECRCLPTYLGTQCNIKVNFCLSEPCMNGATCSNTSTGPLCTCAAGFTGTVCQHLTNSCNSNPCLNNGICIESESSYVCSCKACFFGRDCERIVVDCQSDIVM
ncbi:unnamed protein product [Dimorphilus gyrociliatus]|uniref:EGF-like domain-containing protein n=1 Tax=Dimorphilus gyrociliatus TaxID=2664684 RepID=A0A7I8W900_9ANNE|nr:unnamed protein product [Dimorphilus gyrociliatus]